MDPIITFFGFGLLLAVICYAVFLFWVVRQWCLGQLAYQLSYSSPKVAPLPKFSILIPARNEALGIRACLQSILAQDYPADKIELIVIDDHSDDATAAQVLQIEDERIQMIQLEGVVMGKKAALSAGIARAQAEIILTTDADCTFDRDWLRHIASAFQAGHDMVLAPVQINANNQLLQSWQGLDVCGTLLLTGAAVAAGHPILANGANFAFRKTLFELLNGFTGNLERASGDDIFLLQKAVREPSVKIAFAFHRAATATTAPAETWSQLFWQRLRWAGKTSGYTDWYLLFFQAGAYMVNAGLLLGLVLLLVYPQLATSIITSWVIKAIAEFFYLWFATKKIGNQQWLRWFPISFFVHSIYVVLIGTLALLSFSSRWKGRKV
ncbi:MAG: glycosyltransferase [Bacteroidota bacterium]